MASGDEGVLILSIGMRISPEPEANNRCRPE